MGGGGPVPLSSPGRLLHKYTLFIYNNILFTKKLVVDTSATLIKMFITAARVTSFSSSSTNKRLLGVFISIGAFGVSRFASCNFVSYKRKIPNFVNNNSNYNVKLYSVVNTRLIVYFICNL